MKKYFAFLIGICLTALLLGTMAGCTKEKCIVCPPEEPPAEKEYHFLYSYGFYSWIYTYSTKTGKIIDSVDYSPCGLGDVRFSNDGRYAYYAHCTFTGGDIWITDFATGDTLAITEGSSGQGAWISLSSDEKYLLFSEATELKLLEIPNLTVAYMRNDGNLWRRGTIHPFKNVAYVPIGNKDSLLIIDFRTSAIHDSTMALYWSTGGRVFANSVAVSKDGATLILSTGDGVQLRDAETLEPLQEYHYDYLSRMGPYLHPDGQRVFFLQHWEFTRGQQGEVWELNLRTLLMTRILREEDIATYLGYFGLTPCDMDFTPDGKYAFIINGGAGHDFGVGVILKLDCDTYKIVDAIYPSRGISRLIRINPKEISALEAH